MLESILWPDGPVCPHCGVIGSSGRLNGKTTRMGERKCYACRKKFTVKVGTVFEQSHVPFHKWFQATHLLCSSKKGLSSHQLHRILGVTLKTAWFMTHRIREAMREGKLPDVMGGEGKFVEADGTFVGAKLKTARMRKRCPAMNPSCPWSSAAVRSARTMFRM
jgi:transposase-like protein